MFGLFKRGRYTRLDDAVWMTAADKQRGLARMAEEATQQGKAVLVCAPSQISGSRVKALATSGKPVLILISDFSATLAQDQALLQQIGAAEVAADVQFHTSLDHPVMAMFTPEKMKSLLQGLGMTADEAITHRWVTKAIDNARRKAAGG